MTVHFVHDYALKTAPKNSWTPKNHSDNKITMYERDINAVERP